MSKDRGANILAAIQQMAMDNKSRSENDHDISQCYRRSAWKYSRDSVQKRR